MKSLLPFVIFIVVVLALLALSARARRRQAGAQAQQSERISVGSEVMTTSGLYGTVVARHDDDTVLLAIAPGVEVKWALAALRDIASLRPQYRTADDETDEPGQPADLRKRLGSAAEDGGADRGP